MTIAVHSTEPPPTEPPPETEIRAALLRVIASPDFAASPRLAAFLRYVVERALAGEAARLKGYTIAVEALGRTADFDPRVDPIVRVEAGRLRRRLDRYYAAKGANDPVAIELPRGGYVPRFWRRPEGRAAAGEANPDAGIHGACNRCWADDASALQLVLDQLIERRRLQVRELLAEIEITEAMLRRSRSLLRCR